jgi:exonuclease III
VSGSIQALCALLALAGGGCNLDKALNADTGTESAADDDGAGTADGSGGVAMPMCGGREVRISTHNVESVDAVGSESFDALVSTVVRTNAVVSCFQEVQFWEGDALASLAASAQYPNVVQANQSPAIGGDHTNACISKVPLSVVGSWSGWDLSSDGNANDVGRDIFAVRAYVGAADADDCHLGVITVHLKSGQETADFFRREVESIRLRQAMVRYRTLYPNDSLVIMGDFNESIDDPALGAELTLPPDLPVSYQLGADIELPLTYQPFEQMQAAGLTLANPTQEDGASLFATWNNSVRLDYIWYRDAQLVESEVYNSCRDDGVDEAPPGDFLELRGDPLPCGVSEAASDHFAVVADFVLP